ncbi:MAG: SelB C-terminal domain-containing protein [Burkholderiales bacterium]|nr:SelB C-terminal domain-containing protein [Burkholderiales bacterium]
MIVGTAGHIDHGKTTLVKALTGVDTDRLPEEKKRGISIELGYAFLDVPGDASPASADAPQPPRGTEEGAGGRGPARLGFIDVPGHERLVHTMLAGASGITLALLLVAADDGVMPQTLEHLAVLSLLGIRRGAVVITKIDRADAARRAEVRTQVANLLVELGDAATLVDAPVFELCAHSGEGVSALRDWLFEQAREVDGATGQGFELELAGATGATASRLTTGAVPGAGGPIGSQVGNVRPGFRLAIDRCFTLAGAGTVVTGTSHAGTVDVGDELVLVPDSTAGHAQRVRSLHAQNSAARQAGPGQRCALALPGLDKAAVSRGQWLVAPTLAQATDRLDVRLTLWPGEADALRSGTKVHVHLGAADVMGSVAVLESPDGAERVAPGHAALVQLVLHDKVGAWRGDPVVLRDASASRTLAGGRVLDPNAPVRYRRTPQRLAQLDAWQQPAITQRLAGLLATAANGLDIAAWQRAEGVLGLPALPVDALCVSASGEVIHDQAAWALSAQRRGEIEAGVLTQLAAFHARSPDELGPDVARLRRLAAPRLPDALWRGLLAGLRSAGRVFVKGAQVHLPEHGVRLSATEERIAQKVAPLMLDGAFDPPWVRDLARDTREPEALLRTVLARLAQRGELHAVVKDLYYPLATMHRLAQLAREVGQRDGEVKAATFRDATGLGRKRAIQILEYFDRVGLLRRVQDSHRLRTDTALFLNEENPA